MRRFTDTQLRVLEKERVCCSDVRRIFDDYFEEGCAPTLRARIDSHLANCPDCQEFAETYRLTVRLASELGTVPVSRDIQNRLRKGLNERLGINLPLVS